jgi:hypothetical protein
MGTVSGTIGKSGVIGRLEENRQGVDFTGAWGEDRTLTGTSPKGF